MKKSPPETIAILHYTAPPTIGGVEGVIQAHAQALSEAGFAITVIAGKGDAKALAPGARFIQVPLMNSQAPEVLEMSQALEQGTVPEKFEALAQNLVTQLRSHLISAHHIILHNLFTKHFNLPLTAALYHLLDHGDLKHCISWCHDITWTSAHSRHKVHEGYPWDLLRTYRKEVTYVAVSQKQQKSLAKLYRCPRKNIHVVYNGVAPQPILGLSAEGYALTQRLGMLDSDINLLMPVRVTEAKNIEYAMQVVAALKMQGRCPRLVLTGPPDPHDPESMRYFQTLLDIRKELDIEEEMRFVFENGLDDEPLIISLETVGDLYRLSDAMFMPSHREGFGMPILEAGLQGLPVFTTKVPAATEIGQKNVVLFEETMPPAEVAKIIWRWVETHPTARFRRQVRQEFTWKAILKRDIQPLLVVPV